MKQVTFKQQGIILIGTVISESGDYLQVIVEGQEHIITTHQVLSTLLITQKNIPLHEIIKTLASLMTENIGTTPSKIKLASSLNCTTEDLQALLQLHNRTYLQLVDQAFQEASIILMQGELSHFKIKKNIEAIKSQGEPVNEIQLSSKLQVSLEELKTYCLSHNINLNKLLDKTEPALPNSSLPVPILTADQVLWRGRIINITTHARQRLSERFNIADFNEILDLALSEVCEVTKNKSARKKSLKRHNGVPVRYLVSYKHNLVMVFSKNLSSIITIYSTKDCLWLKNSLNTYEDINFSKNWS